jgi:hypothetical protein
VSAQYQQAALRELVQVLEQAQEQVLVLAQEQVQVLGLAVAQVQALVEVQEPAQAEALARGWAWVLGKE